MEQQRQYVGIDLHRRRSVIVRITESRRGPRDGPRRQRPARVRAGRDGTADRTPRWPSKPPMAGTGRPTCSQAEGATVHLVHPLGLHWDSRRVKNDERDATELAKRLSRGDLPEAWIAPPELRELRELVRYRAKLTALRTSAKAQIHGVMAKEGVLPTYGRMFGPAGQRLLDEMPSRASTAIRVESLRDLLEIYERELVLVESHLVAPVEGPYQGYSGDPGHPRRGPDHGGDLRRRDRRRQPLPLGPPPLLLGRASRPRTASPT